MAKKQKKESVNPHVELDDTPVPKELAPMFDQENRDAMAEKMQELHGIPGDTEAPKYTMKEKIEEESRLYTEIADSARISPFSPLGVDLSYLGNDLQTKEALKEMDSRRDVPTPYGNLPIGYVYDSIYGHLGQNIPQLLQALLKELLYRRLMRL